MSFRTVSLLAVCAFAGLHVHGTSQPPAKQPPAQFYSGKVVPLASVLEKQGIKLDKDAAAQSLALAGDDGKVLVLIKNDGSRMFFKDKRLLDRPMRLTGRLVPGTQLLEVTAVHSIVKGKLHAVYYWCDECQLSFTEAGKCTCCGS